MAVMMVARQVLINKDLLQDCLDVWISPLPRCFASRMDPASAKPSVAASNSSQMDSMRPQAATMVVCKRVFAMSKLIIQI